MTEQLHSGSNEEDAEGHRLRAFGDEESTEGEEDAEGHRLRAFGDEESTEGDDSED